MKAKCKRDGCYNPADCRHGYCGQDCPVGTHLLTPNSVRSYPRTKAPHMGVEIEVEYPDGSTFARGKAIRCHHDGSLGHLGAEYKVLAPTARIAKRAGDLLQELWTRGARVTRKCGLHVHIDARGVPHDRLVALFAWLRLTEDVWVGMMPPSRRCNGYLRRLPAEFPRGHYVWAHATDYDTVEVRIHPGTLNRYKLAGWLAVMATIQGWLAEDAHAYPSDGSWESLIAQFSGEAREYLEARHAGNGMINDTAFQPREEMLMDASAGSSLGHEPVRDRLATATAAV